jgi:hypothetical protein
VRSAGESPPRSSTAASSSARGAALSAENSHAMLCGNPAMVDDTQQALSARGMRRIVARAGPRHRRDVLVALPRAQGSASS